MVNPPVAVSEKNCSIEIQLLKPNDNVKSNEWKFVLRIKRFPLFTLSLLMMQVLFFSFQDEETVIQLSFSPNNRNEFWRLISYSFIHRDLYHIVPNMLVFALVSTHLELDAGFWKTSIIYFTGVLSGALGFDMFERRRRLMGASAGCTSIIFAHIWKIFLKKLRKAEKQDSVLIEDFLVYRLAGLACFAISDIISSILSMDIITNSTSWSSHFSAQINGLIMGICLFHESSTKIHKLKMIVSFVYGMMIMTSLIVCNPWLGKIVCMHANRPGNIETLTKPA